MEGFRLAKKLTLMIFGVMKLEQAKTRTLYDGYRQLGLVVDHTTSATEIECHQNKKR